MRFKLAILIPVCLVLCNLLSAQKTVNLDSVGGDFSALRGFYSVGGQPMGNVKFAKLVEGSPFFNDGYFKSHLLLGDGATITNLPVKLNLLDNQIHFIKDNVELVAGKAVKEIRLIDPAGTAYLFRNGYPKTATSDESTYFQVLSDGKITLLKQMRKQLMESKPYGSATTEQKIKEQANIYLYKNQQLHRIKNNKEILPFLSEQKPAVDEFIKSGSINLKNESEIVKLINHYNTL